METRITDHDGRPAIEVIYYDVTPGNHESWTVPIGGLAVYGELLGYADPTEALDAVIHILRNGLPEPDPVTGKNVFTDAFTLLAHREKAREDTARSAAEESGATSEGVVTASSQAAFDAVHQPIGGGECAMDRCRREARQVIGLKDPTKNCGEETRTTEPVVARAMSLMSAGDDPDAEFRDAVSEALAPYTGEMARSVREWLHELTGEPDDPLADHLPEPSAAPEPVEPEPEPEPILSADELIAKHQEAA